MLFFYSDAKLPIDHFYFTHHKGKRYDTVLAANVVVVVVVLLLLGSDAFQKA
jgi:uncharacterized membrane protein (DUF2068 family)